MRKASVRLIAILTLIGAYLGSYAGYRYWCWKKVVDHFRIDHVAGTMIASEEIAKLPMNEINQKISDYVRAVTPILHTLFSPLIHFDRRFPGKFDPYAQPGAQADAATGRT